MYIILLRRVNAVYIRWLMRRFMFLRCMPTIMATLNSGEKIIFERTHVNV